MKIAKVQAWPFRLPRDMGAATGTAGTPTALLGAAGAYQWSDVYPCLYSTNFETALVKVTLDSGLIGWGEAQAPLAPEIACEIIRLLLAPVLEGMGFDGGVTEVSSLWDRMYSTMRVRGQTGGFMMDAISGIDIALWDLAGKLAGKPVCELIGESKTRVPVYVSGLPPVKREEAARGYQEQGFSKFKLFFDTPAPDEFLRSMDAMPVGAEVAVDALWRFHPESAAAFGKHLDERRALWFEAPLMPEDARAHGELARSIRTPVAIGESYRTRFEIAPFFEAGAVGVLQPDLGRCGITEGLRMVGDAPVVPHISIAMGPQVAAAIHFAAAVDRCQLAEYNPQVLRVANRFLREPIRVEDSNYIVPRAPGLGVEIDEALLP